MAFSALSMSFKNGVANLDALQHYQQALPSLQSSLRSEQDLTSDGVFLTHFILLLYEVTSSFNVVIPSMSWLGWYCHPDRSVRTTSSIVVASAHWTITPYHTSPPWDLWIRTLFVHRLVACQHWHSCSPLGGGQRRIRWNNASPQHSTVRHRPSESLRHLWLQLPFLRPCFTETLWSIA